jgi:FkbM family methyltransferase
MDRPVDRNAVNDGRCFGAQCNAAYDLLTTLPPGLCVDVGAAIGRTAARMLDRSPDSRVVAYEPLAGNRTYFEQRIGDDARVSLRPVAVADRAGSGRLAVPEVLAADMPGYSPLGHLAPGGDIPVDIVTLDDEIGEPVRFLKIDVQGGELGVLKGAERLIAGPGVDLIYVEFNGALAVLRFLRARGYVLFDCPYMARPTGRYIRNWMRRRRDWVLPDWPVIERGMLSTGSAMAQVWPRVPVRGFAAYCAWFFANRVLRCGLQTDLLCVHERVLPALWPAMERQGDA